MNSRLATAAVGLVASLAISAIVWWQFGSLVLFLFVPFVPFLFRDRTSRPPVRRCPDCGFRTREPEYAHCPRDGSELEKAPDTKGL